MAARKYRYDDWFGKQQFVLLKGRDYTCAQMSMAQQLRNAATERGLKLSIGEVPEGLHVRVINLKEPAGSGK